MKDPIYAPVRRVTAPRILATLWVAGWVITVSMAAGLPWAVRALVFFQVPLAFVWWPDGLARIAAVASPRSLMPGGITTPRVVSCIGWLVLAGTPLTWWMWWW
jgi:hypothetical protein